MQFRVYTLNFKDGGVSVEKNSRILYFNHRPIHVTVKNEAAMLPFRDCAYESVQVLSDAGFELSLDDYGSGYSNMSYMLSLPFKMIKIDKYIVWAAFTDKRAEKALAATIKMIKSIGMTVLAEGVETPEQAEWLTESGCDYLQGFYFSRPIPKKDFLNIMLQNKENN